MVQLPCFFGAVLIELSSLARAQAHSRPTPGSGQCGKSKSESVTAPAPRLRKIIVTFDCAEEKKKPVAQNVTTVQ